MDGLTTEQIDRFVDDGFVRLDGAFPREIADAGRALLWERTGCDPHDRSTWTRPVVRLGGYWDAPFHQAAGTARLHTAFDQLVGVDRWRPLQGLGTWPVRFPHDEEPGDDGWHVEGSFPIGDGYGLNARSDGRALLLLFLFSDVGPDDAPTRVRVGSHHDIPPLLAPHGDAGAEFFAFAPEAVAATEHRPVAHATGAAGDVYLCHPFLVHAGQPHRGTTAKFMAQPPLLPAGRFDLEDPLSPVERVMRFSLP
ncbi:MAG: phytanoyl-CoA dioxygenase family protein [Pseudonocardia sp.]|nr:phytanoyl-CoA dioxygenase family protein [Pseudonocardia sp.]